MNKKRALSILMAAAMAAGTLVTSVPVYADDVEEITWMFWDDLEATEDLISKGYKEVIDRFNEEYDGKYHVTPITTNLEEYDGKLNALIAAGQTPDVYICNPGPNMDVYVNAGAAADLTDILENQEDHGSSYQLRSSLRLLQHRDVCRCWRRSSYHIRRTDRCMPEASGCRLHTNLLLRWYRMVLIHDRRLSV